ncbi:unnamed protein product [Adineta steineri]|uniref:Uncharacterized protein n=1 Tax=Adineta steineri TaxID=433720 RepID=A0A819DX70_9BILA|nr:unnamed protein product [Adineta steineri]CAF1399731.1 unnamed protein product [Adineta steineri]CAF3761013.1 unnamed protein product [Adineta steineri]CAF3840584.1 unnamed protein product [Adineta steineri]
MVAGNGNTGANSGLAAAEAVVACRSMGCSKVASVNGGAYWQQTQACRFTCPDGASALQTCYYMLHSLKCPADGMNLKECIQRGFWGFGGATPGSYGVNLVCTECGED